MKVNEMVRDILAECVVEENVLKLPERQLDRNTYVAVNKVLEAMGGKWNRKVKGHIFEQSPASTLEEIVLSGEYTDEKEELQMKSSKGIPRSLHALSLTTEWKCI